MASGALQSEMQKALIIFAKEPVPGKVKTRLAHAVGKQEAAKLYRAMLADCLEKAVSLDGVRPLLFWALETGAIPDCPEFPGLEMFEQQGADLGARMNNAFASAFSLGAEVCCCIGSDLPDLPPDYIRQAFAELEAPEIDVVFGPAEDGGYYLVGMKRVNAGLFADIAWSTSQVLATSLKRAGESRLRTVLLPVWYDIDLIGDLQRLAASPGMSAPRTRMVFSRIADNMKEATSHMKPVLVIAAVPQETALLEKALGKSVRHVTGIFEVVEGFIGSLPVVVCAGGIGKVNAAIATTALIERYAPGLVINTGCAGAYPGSGLAIGDLAVADAEILGDEGVITSAGWLDFQGMGLPSLVQGEQRYYNEIPLTGHAVVTARLLAEHHGRALARGRFATVSTCSGSLQRGEELVQRYNPIVENMEGAAVALTCLRYAIDCLEIRGISNLVEERNIKGWDIPRAVEVAQHFVLRYLEAMAQQ